MNAEEHFSRDGLEKERPPGLQLEPGLSVTQPAFSVAVFTGARAATWLGIGSRTGAAGILIGSRRGVALTISQSVATQPKVSA